MESTDEKIFDFAYRMALDDATLQGAYIGHDKKKLRDCAEASAAVKRYIDGVMEEAEEPDFAVTAGDVINAFKQFLTADDDAEFTFGNAQKLINMTAKYLFITTYGQPQLRERFVRCHCPLDGIVLAAVVTSAGKIVDEDAGADGRLVRFLEKCARSRPRKGGWGPKDDFKWSRLELGDERYDLFQDAVRVLAQAQGQCPIEYDYHAWDALSHQS